MGQFKDISGQKFGRLTALYRLYNYHWSIERALELEGK